MHPLLASGRRLLGYLLLWIPIGALTALVSNASVVVVAPACVFFAFVCLTPLYICRTRPLQISTAANLAVLHLVSAAAASALFVGAAFVAAFAIGKPGPEWTLLFGMGVSQYLASVGLHYAALAAEATRNAERRAAEARTLAREAELLALRIQLNPHFLFNSLHSIAALATLDGVRAREMCVRLADFLRGSIALGSRESIPLREELALARRD